MSEALDVFTCPLEGVNLIEASAGTGKTWNICGLYLRLLFEKECEVEQILVVTFTKAATAELRERIRDRLAAVLAALEARSQGDAFVGQLIRAAIEHTGATEKALRDRVHAALQSFDEAAIFTIHGYCQRALGETPFSAAQPFVLDVMTDDIELREQVAADFWRREVASGTLPAALARYLAERGDSPQSWAELLGRRLAKPLARLEWPAPPEPGFERLGEAVQSAWENAQALWQQAPGAPANCVRDALGQLNANSYKPEGVDAAEQLWNRAFAESSTAPLDEDKAKLLRQSFLVSKTKKNNRPPEHPFFAAADALCDAVAQSADQLERARLGLIRRFFDTALPVLRSTKRERRLLAYDDMLANLHRALCSGATPWLAEALRQRYPAALIDEFQDTDPLQFAVFRAIYAPAGPLFLVGDPKQAIYSFRNADLPTYLEARNEADRHYSLGSNQRSSRELIAANNALFGRNPRAFVLDGLDFEPVEIGAKPRPAFHDATDGKTAALRIWKIDKQGETYPERKTVRQLTLEACAAEIARLIEAGLDGRIRIGTEALAPGDIAVLVRSHQQARDMKFALAALGVVAVELSQQSVFASVEAEELERVLRAIREPARLGGLLAALATGLMGEESATIAALTKNERRLQEFIDRFTAYRERWNNRGAGLMLRQWIATEHIVRRLLPQPEGERRVTNLLHLLELLHQESAQHPNPEALLRWFASRRREAGADEAAQLRLESDRERVQIVTIHKSKGLEYPVTFAPFLWDAQSGKGTGKSAGVEYRSDSGETVIDFRPEAGEQEQVKQQCATDRAAEEVRLAYVALTRSVYRSYLVGGCYSTSGFGRLSHTASTRSILNWLVAGAGMSWADWRTHKLGAEAIDAAWDALAAAHPAAIHCEALAPVRGRAVALPALPPGSLEALEPPPSLPPAWRIGSFSRLVHGGGEAAPEDHDLLARSASPGPTPAAIAADDILHFPRGAAAGDCIHAVFENADFTDSSGWPQAIDEALAAHPQHSDEPAAQVRDQGIRQLQQMLKLVVATELFPGFRLAMLPRRRRLTELGFHLPAPLLQASTINAWLSAHAYRMPPLSFRDLHGYLSGFIDLVFEHEGRFYILDWKSNLLGFDPAAYAPDRTALAMEDNGYHLQHLLYSVALHRYLASRLRDYAIERNFGGVLYLFVRGVRPGWRNADGSPAGVFLHRADRSTLESLDRMIATAQEPTR